MSAGPVGADVFRGMDVERIPLRLGRGRSAPSTGTPVPVPEPALSAQEEGFRSGLEQGLREGREQGLRSGREEGLRQGRADAVRELEAARHQAVQDATQPLQAEHRRVHQLAAGLGLAFDAAVAAAQEEMVALCYEAICRVLGDTLVQPEGLRTQLAHLLASHGAGDQLVLHVHPQDAEMLQQGEREQMRWQADPDVALGGCIVRCAAGGIDARLETILDTCKTALLAGRARRGAAGSDTGVRS